MAITLVGTPQSGSAVSGGDVTLTFDGTPQEGDVVVLIGGNSDTDGAGLIGPSTSGYTEQELIQTGAINVSAGVWTKRLGATPDSDVVCLGSGDAAEGATYVCYVLRGVDPTTPMDASVVSTGPATGTNPDPGAITTVTDEAWVIVAYAADDTTGGSSVAPTDYSNLAHAEVTDTNRMTTAAATREIATAGTEDPAAFGEGTSTNHYTFTIAVRPESAVSPHVFFDITDLPADFGNAETATITVRTRGVDIGATPLKLFAQLYQSNETTALSDEVEVASHASDSSFANSAAVTFTGLNTTADKSVWDAARIRFRWGT